MQWCDFRLIFEEKDEFCVMEKVWGASRRMTRKFVRWKGKKLILKVGDTNSYLF